MIMSTQEYLEKRSADVFIHKSLKRADQELYSQLGRRVFLQREYSIAGKKEKRSRPANLFRFERSMKKTKKRSQTETIHIVHFCQVGYHEEETTPILGQRQISVSFL